MPARWSGGGGEGGKAGRAVAWKVSVSPQPALRLTPAHGAGAVRCGGGLAPPALCLRGGGRGETTPRPGGAGGVRRAGF